MNLEQITTELRQRLETWLDTPNDASEGLDELRSKLQALGGTIGKKAASDALRALQSSEKGIRRSRQREAADTVAADLRPLGIILVAQAPPKRQRKASAKPAAGPQPGQQASAPVGAAPAAQSEAEPSPSSSGSAFGLGERGRTGS